MWLSANALRSGFPGGSSLMLVVVRVRVKADQRKKSRSWDFCGGDVVRVWRRLCLYRAIQERLGLGVFMGMELDIRGGKG